jgi:hypothetical protein
VREREKERERRKERDKERKRKKERERVVATGVFHCHRGSFLLLFSSWGREIMLSKPPPATARGNRGRRRVNLTPQPLSTFS